MSALAKWLLDAIIFFQGSVRKKLFSAASCTIKYPWGTNPLGAPVFWNDMSTNRPKLAKNLPYLRRQNDWVTGSLTQEAMVWICCRSKATHLEVTPLYYTENACIEQKFAPRGPVLFQLKREELSEELLKAIKMNCKINSWIYNWNCLHVRWAITHLQHSLHNIYGHSSSKKISFLLQVEQNSCYSGPSLPSFSLDSSIRIYKHFYFKQRFPFFSSHNDQRVKCRKETQDISQLCSLVIHNIQQKRDQNLNTQTIEFYGNMNKAFRRSK